MMSKRLLALLLAGGLASACDDASKTASSIWSQAKSTVNDATEAVIGPEEAEKSADEIADEFVAAPQNAADCAARSKTRKTIEAENVRVTGTIIGANGDSVAMVNDGQRADVALRAGDYIGTRCWRVKAVDHDHLLFEQPYRDAAGTVQARTLQVEFGVKAAAAIIR